MRFDLGLAAACKGEKAQVSEGSASHETPSLTVSFDNDGVVSIDVSSIAAAQVLVKLRGLFTMIADEFVELVEEEGLVLDIFRKAARIVMSILD